jgi:tetratricopeptide (TPR) repeat protein
MAPEAARGEVGRVDERSDVFGLGSVLCVILTGQPAFVGADVEVIVRDAEAGNVADAFARLDGCGADAELVALAKRCLAPDPAQRPRDASEVAAAIQSYQVGVEDRARKAETERAAAVARAEEAQITAREAEAREAAEKRQAEEARARAEAERRRADESERRVTAERRARRLIVGLAAAALLLVVGGGTWTWLAQQERERKRGITLETDTRTRSAMEQARAKSKDGWKRHDLAKLREALADVDKAVKIVFVRGNASPELRQEVEALRGEIEERIRAAEKNAALLAALLDVYEPPEMASYARGATGRMVALPLPSAEEQFVAAFGRLTINIDSDPLDEVVARLATQPQPVVQEVVAGLDAWALERRRRKPPRPEAEWRRLLDVAERLDRNTLRKKLRRLLAGSPLERTDANAAAWDRTRAQLNQEAAKIDATREPVLGLLTLANVLEAFGDRAKAEVMLRACLARYPKEVVLLNALGSLVTRHQPPRLAEAIGFYRAARSVRPLLGFRLGSALARANQAPEAEAVFRDLLRQQPDNPGRHAHLADALIAQKKFNEAVTTCRKAIALHPDSLSAHIHLGRALGSQKKYGEEETVYRKAIQLRPDYPLARYFLGLALYEQKRYTEAEAAFRKAIDLQPDYPAAFSNLGLVLSEQKRYAEAEVACRKAITLRPDYALAHISLGNVLLDQKRYADAEAAFRKAIALQSDSHQAHFNLGNALADQKRHADAEVAFRKAITLKPDFPDAHVNLGNVLHAQKRYGEAEAAYCKAIKLQPDDHVAHHNLGNVLGAQERYGEAEAAFRKAITLKPDFPEAHFRLGNALRDQKKYGEAEAAFRQTIALKPDYPQAHHNLGLTLLDQKKSGEAVGAFRQAIAIKSNDSEAYFGLGTALYDLKKPGDAVAACRKAIEIQPGYAEAHCGLGAALRALKKPEEAVVAFRRAIAIKGTFPLAHNNLGLALLDLKKSEEAIVAFRKAIALQPDYAEAHYNLGRALRGQKKLDEAAIAYREAIRIKPDLAEAHCNLGHVLLAQGRFRDALVELRQGHVLGSRQLHWTYPSADWVKRAEQLVTLEKRLAAVQAGKAQPKDAQERLALGLFCAEYRQRYVAAIDFVVAAFVADPKLAADLQAANRYNAACAAALAAAGKGEDAKGLSAEQRAKLRQRTLEWLQADLDAYAKLAEKENKGLRQVVRQRLSHWQQDADLAVVRDAKELAALPEPERKAWQQLWGEVAALLKKCQ